jgi:hypothetical protein
MIKKTQHTFLAENAIKEHKMILELENEVNNLIEKKDNLEINVFDLLFTMNSINPSSIKHNETVNKDLFKKITADLEIVYDKNNIQDEQFLFNIMKTYNPYENNKYFKIYKEIISENKKIEDYYQNENNQRALGTYFYEKIKEYLERVKKISTKVYENKKNKLNKIKTLLQNKTKNYNDKKYNLNNYAHLINNNPDNLYFLIKIDFDIYKYKNIIKSKKEYTEQNKYLLSYTSIKNNQEIIVTSQRGYKMVEKKLDPECYNINAQNPNILPNIY